MKKELEIGMVYNFDIVVTDKDTAAAIGSGNIFVLSTPFLIALMESASMKCVSSSLDEGFTTVGTKVNIEHIAATPVGMKVTITSTLTKIDGRKLCFDVEAFDEKEKIGFGTHERFVINTIKFMNKVNNKKV